MIIYSCTHYFNRHCGYIFLVWPWKKWLWLFTGRGDIKMFYGNFYKIINAYPEALFSSWSSFRSILTSERKKVKYAKFTCKNIFCHFQQVQSSQNTLTKKVLFCLSFFLPPPLLHCETPYSKWIPCYSPEDLLIPLK